MEKMYNRERKRGTKIHVATYAISQTEMIAKKMQTYVTMEHGTN